MAKPLTLEHPSVQKILSSMELDRLYMPYELGMMLSTHESKRTMANSGYALLSGKYRRLLVREGMIREFNGKTHTEILITFKGLKHCGMTMEEWDNVSEIYYRAYESGMNLERNR